MFLSLPHLTCRRQNRMRLRVAGSCGSRCALLKRHTPSCSLTRMLAALRLIFSLAICVSMPLVILPSQAANPRAEKADCCAKMKSAAPANDCDQRAPKSEQDKQCCAACIFGLGLFLSSATP